MINPTDFADIFKCAVEKAYEQDQPFLDKLAEVEHCCKNHVRNMHMDVRIVTPELLQVHFVGSPHGILTQGDMNVAMSKRQDGTVTFHMNNGEDLSADQPTEEILGGFLHAIARQTALNGALQAVRRECW